MAGFVVVGGDDIRGFESSQSDFGSLQITDVDERQNEITKTHWIKNELRPLCARKNCGKKFNMVLERPHHCRKCGDVFCKDCLHYKRKLNLLANYDLEGKSYKVCQACFEAGQHTEGVTRRLTEEFTAWRKCRQTSNQQKSNGCKPASRFWRDRVDLATECERLRLGFHKSIVTSEVGRTLSEMKNMLVTPDWQKSSVWLQETMAENCQGCSEGFGFLRKKYSCKLCGRLVCKSCCTRELLVYVPDSDHNSNVSSKEACISVIKVLGSPEKEPEISLLLHVCEPCHLFLADRQLLRAKKDLSTELKVTREEVVVKVMTWDQAMKKLQLKITEQLFQYQDTIEMLEDSRKSTGDQSNTKVLAKAQGDLSDHFATYSLKIPSIKKLLPECETETQRKLVKAFLKAKSDFYLDKVSMFRASRRKLGESTPEVVLKHIQNIVNRNAIVAVQAYMKQVTMETIHLCGKYSFNHQDLSPILVSLYKEHRLINPSERRIRSGTQYVAEVVLHRILNVLEKSQVQLEMSAGHKSCQKTKDALRLARQQVQLLTVEQIMKNT
ncbi:uncharacterized protein LOC127859352 isoform X2 [Dreissena polymorpha]|uniref:uncharacterized protein LOC127859352 isoform X2 n=1 Tax=Dreissena polymorpha TaxID=45954 RepID=UPI002263D974|nr:uncharacterized protein LOC127859352 isoform X2 [Dreissena polymorpha]